MPAKNVTIEVTEEIVYRIADTESDEQATNIAMLRYNTGAPLDIVKQKKEVRCTKVEVE